MILNLVRRLALLIAVGVTAAATGCGGDDSGGSDADVVVIASTTHLADLAVNVAGERAEVDGILSAESDPHDYEPLPSDAEGLLEADLLLESGGDVDLWMDQLIESSGSDARELVLLDRVEATGDDPHWWQDPANAISAVEAIRDDLIEVDPEGRATYEDNAAAYVRDLRELDREIARCIERVPMSRRLLVTSHDALGPFADRYRIEVVGAVLPALTTQAQPSAGETAELVDLIRETGVSTVFPEAGVSGELEAAIAEEADASIGGELWADALGPEGSDGATYIAAMQANAEKLVDGFSGGETACSFEPR